jgi:hypothetical protein
MKKLFIAWCSLFPTVGVVFAISGDQLYQNIVKSLFEPLIQFAIVIAFVYFLYGGFMFVVNLYNQDTDKMNAGKRHLLWGTIGLFIMLSIGGILSLINTSLGTSFM